LITTQYVESLHDAVSIATTNYTFSSWKPIKADRVAVQIGIGTLNASRLKYQIQGKAGDSLTRPSEIYTSSTVNTSLDEIINITEPVKYIRVGLAVGGLATPNSAYSYLSKAEVR